MTGLERTLARIAFRDDRFIATLQSCGGEGIELDQRTSALTRLGALISLDGHAASFIATVQDAQGAGASDAEIVATLLAVLPSVGVVRASSAAPKLRSGWGTNRIPRSWKPTSTSLMGVTKARHGDPTAE